MIKKISLLSLLFVCFFSFSQEKTNKSDSEVLKDKEAVVAIEKKYQKLKKNVVKLADYFNNQLNFTTKQKSNFIESYSNYANNISRISVKNLNRNVVKFDADHEMLKLYMKFSEERDNSVKSTLNRRQKKQYQELIKNINYKTLEIK